MSLSKNIAHDTKTWSLFLASLETRYKFSAAFSLLINDLWSKLVALVADTPLPLADKLSISPSGTHIFQFYWRYPDFLLEIKVDEHGQIFWFGHSGSAHQSGDLEAEQSLDCLKPWLELAIEKQ